MEDETIARLNSQKICTLRKGGRGELICVRVLCMVHKTNIEMFNRKRKARSAKIWCNLNKTYFSPAQSVFTLET